MPAWPEYFRAALRLWLAQPGQALLSMLGVTVGVGGLFLVLAVGRGAENEIQAAMGRLGAGTVVLVPTAVGEVPGSGSLPPMFLRQLQDLLPGSGILSAPSRERWLFASSSVGESLMAQIRGVVPVQARVSGEGVAQGRYIVDLDILTGSRVCVLGAGLARALYPRGDALGQQLRLGQSWHTVVGVLPNDGLVLGQRDAREARNAESVYVPLNSPLFERSLGYTAVTLRFADKAALSAAMPLIHRALEVAELADSVALKLPLSALRSQYSVQHTVAALLLAASLITLIVAGVGVANTMLLNVSARRPEIGLRRAVGATRRHILFQFVLEAVVLTVSGGIAGVLLGVAAALAMIQFTGWTLSIGGASTAGGLLAATLLGAAAGGYPAWRAAGLAPVNALRGPV